MKTYWASRDTGPNGLPEHIKIWDKEPRLFDNGSWVGKIYMGMFDLQDWKDDIPNIEKGECIEVRLKMEVV